MLILDNEDGTFDEIALFIKFGTKKNIESMRSGNIYTNNLKYFIDLEDKYNQVGIGDKDEATLLLNDTKVQFKNSKTGEELSIGKIFFGQDIPEDVFGNIVVRNQIDEHTKVPVLCLVVVNKNDLINVGEDLILRFTDEVISRFKSEFKDYTHALVISAGDFAKRIKDTSKSININAQMDYIKYYDPNINQQERVNDYFTWRRALWKKDYFKDQNEFRIIFDNSLIEEGQVLMNIGDLSDISLIYEIDEILNKDFALKVS